MMALWCTAVMAQNSPSRTRSWWQCSSRAKIQHRAREALTPSRCPNGHINYHPCDSNEMRLSLCPLLYSPWHNPTFTVSFPLITLGLYPSQTLINIAIITVLHLSTSLQLDWAAIFTGCPMYNELNHLYFSNDVIRKSYIESIDLLMTFY